MTVSLDNMKPQPARIAHLGRLSIPMIWAGVICWLSLTASPPTPPGIFGWDKLLHAAAYALLALAVAQYLQIHVAVNRRAAIYAALLATAYGGLMEILQLALQTGRMAEWWDLVADAVGALAGCVIFRHTAALFSQYHARNRDHG